MATPKKRNGKWYIEICVNLTRKAKSFSTKEEARNWAIQEESKLLLQKKTGIIIGKTCADAFSRYESEISAHKKGKRWETLRLRNFSKTELDHKLPWKLFGEIPLSELTRDILGQWRDKRLKTVSGSTVNREFNLMSHVFTLCHMEWEWLSANPLHKFRRPKDSPSRQRRISEEEIEMICIALGFNGKLVVTRSQVVAVAFLFAIETGMRAGEICAMRPDWIKGQFVSLPKGSTKNDQSRDVPLSKRAVELLNFLPKKELFNTTTSALDALFRKYRDKTPIKDLHFHDTRHEAVTRLSKKLNVLELARVIGHRDINMLLVYYNESAEDIAKKLND